MRKEVLPVSFSSRLVSQHHFTVRFMTRSLVSMREGGHSADASIFIYDVSSGLYIYILHR
jgi:hypothetical protein